VQLEEIAEELYGLLPEEFTAARDRRTAQLRADGERELSTAVKALRRPAVAAWLVNAMLRHRGDEVEALLALGDALREAQTSLDADQLRELNRRRQEVLGALGRQARALARHLGRPVTEPVADDVEATLRAALADPGAAAAVRSGRLTAPLSYAGLGEVDLTDAVALAPSRPRPARPARPTPADHDRPGGATKVEAEVEAEAAERAQEQARAALRAAEDALRRAEQARRRAEQHRDSALRRSEAARERVDAADARVAELEGVLADARDRAESARAAWEPLQADTETAVRAVDESGTAVDEARAAVETARNELR
jgi:hypothetical protein